MIQPAGTRTYKGNRVSNPGAESFEKSEKILNDASDFHAKGKATEAKSKEKPEVKAAEPVKPEEGKK